MPLLQYIASQLHFNPYLIDQPIQNSPHRLSLRLVSLLILQLILRLQLLQIPRDNLRFAHSRFARLFHMCPDFRHDELHESAVGFGG